MSLPITLDGQDFIVPRADLIFCLCPVCLNEINWRHQDASYLLTGSCCCIAFRSYPANKLMTMYRVEAKAADMTNVHWLWRRSAVDGLPPPGYG